MIIIQKELVKFDKLMKSLVKRNIIINVLSSKENDPGHMLNMNTLIDFIGKYKKTVKAKFNPYEEHYSKNANLNLYFEAFESNKMEVKIKKEINFMSNNIFVTINYTSEQPLWKIIPLISPLIKKYQEDVKSPQRIRID